MHKWIKAGRSGRGWGRGEGGLARRPGAVCKAQSEMQLGRPSSVALRSPAFFVLAGSPPPGPRAHRSGLHSCFPGWRRLCPQFRDSGCSQGSLSPEEGPQGSKPAMATCPSEQAVNCFRFPLQ